MFVNTIPLRLKYDEDLTFEELLKYSKSVLKSGLTHAKLQFSEYTTDLRNLGIHPNCVYMFSMVSNSTNNLAVSYYNLHYEKNDRFLIYKFILKLSALARN